MPDQASQIDPTISLGIKPAGAGGLGMTGDPLDTIGKFATIQNSMNQNRLFQQTFAARQKAGQIIAQAPDLETGLDALYKDPVTAPFAGEVANSIRQGQQTLTQIQGAQQEQSQSALAGWMKTLPAAIADPSQLGALTKAQLSTMSPQARARVEPAIGAITTALTEGLPQDPQMAKAIFNQRLAGLSISAGATPENLSGIIGKPTSQDTGGGIAFGTQLPPQLGGAFVQSNGIGKSLAPQVVTANLPGGATQPVVVGGGASGATGGAAGLGVRPGPASVSGSPGGAVSGPGSSPAETPQSPGLPHGIGVPSPTAQQKAYLDKSGSQVADLQEEMNTDAQHIPAAINRIDTLTGALGNFQSGGGAQAREGFAKALQAAKNSGAGFVSQDLIDAVGNKSLSDTQLFNANIKPLAVTELKEAAQGTGRVMRSEVDAFLDMMNSTNDPKAIMQLLNQARLQLQVGYDRSQKFPEFKQGLASGSPGTQGLDLSDFPSWYIRNYSPQGLPGSNAAGGVNLGPVDPGRALGVAPPVQWKIQDGKLVRQGASQ